MCVCGCVADVEQRSQTFNETKQLRHKRYSYDVDVEAAMRNKVSGLFYMLDMKVNVNRSRRINTHDVSQSLIRFLRNLTAPQHVFINVD